MTILCATGHRPNKLGGYGVIVKNRLTACAWFWLKENRPDEVISGMAGGWDQAVALACVGLGIPFVAAVPFVGQERNRPYSAQHDYKVLLSKAARTVVVSDGGYEVWKMFKRNEWMVDNSDGCVALWNGDHSGGTWDTVKYVERRQQARPDYTFVNLWPEWERLSGHRSKTAT